MGNARIGAGWLVAAALAWAPQAAAEAGRGRSVDAIREALTQEKGLAGIQADEALVAEQVATLLSPWRDGWLRGDAAAFSDLWLPGAKGLQWGGSRGKPWREKEGISEFLWRPGPAGDHEAQARRYLETFRKIDRFSLEPERIVPGDGSARLDVRYDLRGITRKGRLRHDRGTLGLRLTRSDGGWRVSGVETASLESLEAAQPAFEDATEAWGLASVPMLERREAIRRGGYALAVSDFDGDGRPDMLVGGWGPVRLYRNTGRRFEDVTEAAGLKGETLVKSAALVDMDNDGKRDLLMLRFVDDGKGEGDFVAYRNIGDGRFERRAEVLSRTRHYDRTMPLAVADFDLSGTLDLYVGFPGSRDFTDTAPLARGLTRQGMWLNGGSWDFSELPVESGLFRPEMIAPHSAVAADLNDDGRPDLLVVDDRANLSPLYLNEGGARFRDISSQAGVLNYSWGMTAAVGDYDGDGRQDIVMTNIDLRAGRRILASRAGRASGPEAAGLEKLGSTLGVGNRLFRNLGDGTFAESTGKAGLSWAGEAPAGAEWIDYNADGWLDLYVANGLWSGGEEDISSLFVQLHAAKAIGSPGMDRLVESALNSPMARDEGQPNPVLRLLREDRSLSMGGGEANRLFRNNGDGTFTEIGFLAGADRREDGYVISAVDVDGDGRQDLILRNGDPAPGRRSPPVVLLRNRVEEPRSLTVAVAGTRSNRDGIGARVVAWVGGRKLVREIRSTSGAVQAEPVAFFGLGRARRAERLEVHWPSGGVEEFNAVPAGRILITEGEGYSTLAKAR